MKALKLPDLTFAEYIQQEIESDTKYEYHDGKIYAGAGGTLNHGKICGNVYAELRSKLKGKASNCLPFNSEIKLHIAKTGSYVYPDAMVICGDVETPENNEHAVTNPVLIIEVLSKSTAEYDRGDKFYFYRQIPGFREYVLIEQDRHIVDVHFKAAQTNMWRITRYQGLDAVVKLRSIGVEMGMEDLYFSAEISGEGAKIK